MTNLAIDAQHIQYKKLTFKEFKTLDSLSYEELMKNNSNLEIRRELH